MRTKPENYTDLEWELSEFMRSLTNQPCTPELGDKLEALRLRAKTWGSWLVMNVPASREKALAKTHLEDSIMWAVKALVLHDELNEGV